MLDLVIRNATIVNEGTRFKGSLGIRDGKIVLIKEGTLTADSKKSIEAEGLLLLPGVIDDQVHFRDPGLTHKGDIYTESRAAAAGGVTSYMEMPNTKPQTVTQEALKNKYAHASKNSLVNYSFYMGATNDNIDEILKTDPSNVCGVKVFMGSSTGNMLVDNPESLQEIFSKSKLPIAVHCEDEATIQNNTRQYKAELGENIPFRYHPIIRSAEACYKSSSLAVELAKKNNARLHILHLSSAKELDLFEPGGDLRSKKITCEVCIHHLWFNDTDYDKYGARIKWNPAVKSVDDQLALLKGLHDDRIDVIATDHAPHTLDEKNNTYFKTPSGGPLVQHSLVAMLELSHQKKISLEKVVEKMCHAPADLFHVSKRGFLREGYWADLVLVDPDNPWEVAKENILYKCAWSPFEGVRFTSKIHTTIVNGKLVYSNDRINNTDSAMRLEFER